MGQLDPGFLDRGSNLQRGFDLLILPDYSKNSPYLLILSQGGGGGG